MRKHDSEDAEFCATKSCSAEDAECCAYLKNLLLSKPYHMYNCVAQHIHICTLMLYNTDTTPVYIDVLQLALMVAETIDCGFPYFPIPYGCW